MIQYYVGKNKLWKKDFSSRSTSYISVLTIETDQLISEDICIFFYLDEY